MRNSTAARLLPAASLLLFAACSNSGSAGDVAPGTELSTLVPSGPGSAQAAGAQTGIRSPYIQDPNLGGNAANLILEELNWGRLVDVFDTANGTGAKRLIYKDAVILPWLVGNTGSYELRENLAQGCEFVIKADRGSSGFKQTFVAATSNLPAVADNGLPSGSIPPWTMVPRNAAFSMRFNDLLDASTVSARNLKVSEELSGLAATLLETRTILDQHHGALADPDGDGVMTFYSTRILVDFTIDFVEAINTNPPLAINVLGLPASANILRGNIALRIPTQLAPQAGQTTLLRNASGNPLSFTGNGTVDSGVPTRDVVRTSRSGGDTYDTGDPYNGRLMDLVAPFLLGEAPTTMSGPIAQDANIARGWILPTIAYNDATCAKPAQVGDTFGQNGFLGVVYDAGQFNGNAITGMRVRALFDNIVRPVAGGALLTSAYDAQNDVADCFVQYLPAAGMAPNLDVSPSAQLQVRFNEPVAAQTLNGFESFTVSSTPGAPSATELVAGEVLLGPGLDQATFASTVPFSHASGTAETYHVRIGTNANMAIEDLAGNALVDSLAAASFQLDAAAPTGISGNISLRFDTADELGNNGFSEMRGQFLYDLAAGELKPRPVAHFEGNADRTKPVPAVMTPFASGVQTPLVPLGSKLHQVWRYADFGYNLMDESFTNLDVEGISWAPVGGQVISDIYPEFAIALGHSEWNPDEIITPTSGFPLFPTSGLVSQFDANLLEPAQNVHDKSAGYIVNPADLYTSATGVALMPFPLNGAVAPEDRQYSTWRDTAITALGGVGGAGVPTGQEGVVTGVGPGSSYGPGVVPSIGLPLLTEFRCYPSAAAIGLNALDISLAANSSSRPNFRAFSSGGFNGTGNVSVNPDNSPVATGGYGAFGQATQGTDNSFYIGAVDFVTTTSRVHSIWFDTRLAAPNYGAPVLDLNLPEGTQVELAFRGADGITGGTPNQPFYIGSDAAGLDPYGDPLPATNGGMPQFFNGDASWKNDPAALNGARYFQVRISFVGNPLTNVTARLKGLGFSWND